MTDAFTHPWPFGGIFLDWQLAEMPLPGLALSGSGLPATLPGASPAPVMVAGLLCPDWPIPESATLH